MSVIWPDLMATERAANFRSPGGASRWHTDLVHERNVDIQLRFRWTPGTSALWDNRITIHNASWDYAGRLPRHGTRVTSLAEKPYFDPAAPTRRQALGLLDDDEKAELGLVEHGVRDFSLGSA